MILYIRQGYRRVNQMLKNKKAITMAVCILIIMSSTIIFARPDMRFIIVNTWGQLTTSSDLEQIKIEDQRLNQISIEEIKNNQTEITYDNTLALTSEEYPINENMKLDLVYYKDTDLQMDKALVDHYEALSDDVKSKTGDRLYIKSSYRSNEEQEILYSQDKQTAAIPGTSEHETGLALDVYIEFFAGNGFLKSQAGQYVNEYSWKHGFIIRYPVFKSRITGIRFEPWHIRYVGKPHAEIISKSGMTFEEYIQGLGINQFFTSQNFVISRQSGGVLLIPDFLTEIVVSPDNMGNYIITGIHSGDKDK